MSGGCCRGGWRSLEGKEGGRRGEGRMTRVGMAVEDGGEFRAGVVD